MFKQQKQIIADYVSKNPNKSAKQVSAELGLNYNSVRGRISELKKSKILAVNDNSEYTFIGSWWWKKLKTGFTNDVSRNYLEVYAYTYEAGSTEAPNRYRFLKNAVEEKYKITIDEAGYDFEETDFPEDEYKYPNVAVGKGTGIWLN